MPSYPDPKSFLGGKGEGAKQTLIYIQWKPAYDSFLTFTQQPQLLLIRISLNYKFVLAPKGHGFTFLLFPIPRQFGLPSFQALISLIPF